MKKRGGIALAFSFEEFNLYKQAEIKSRVFAPHVDALICILNMYFCGRADGAVVGLDTQVSLRDFVKNRLNPDHKI